jgi:hypothetical protein
MTSLVIRSLLLGAMCVVLQHPGLAYVTDPQLYAPVNYFTSRPPAAGATYLDAAFGTEVMRISDALGTPDAADVGMLGSIGNEYSTMTPFNADNSRLLLQHRSYFALYDGKGRYLNDLPFEITASSEPRWSRHDANVLYYVTGNQLKQFDTASRSAAAVHTFPEYFVVNGLGESDICFDGDHFVLVGDNRQIFTYELSTGTKGPVLTTTGIGGVDNVQITPDDHVLVSWYASGPGRYQGVELFDRDMNFLRQVSTVIGHMDVTRDVDGVEVVLLANAANPTPPAGCSNGVVKIALADGAQTCVIAFDWSLGLHISASDQSGWFIVSTYAWGDPNPATSWTRYAGELLQVKMNGTEVKRLAHHRSRPFSSYWWTPRASVSRDGTRLVYSSNYGLPRHAEYPQSYIDAYLIDLARAIPATGGSSRAVSNRVEQSTGAVSYSGSWYSNAAWFHSANDARLAMDSDSRATFTFTGNGVRWIGFRDEWSGMANVYIDGTLRAVVDTFGQPSQPQQVLFSATDLSNGTHTLQIEPAGQRNPQSGGYWIWVDALEVVTRLEEDVAAIRYSCPPGSEWYTHVAAAHSNGVAAVAMAPGCQATLAFTGSAVSWFGYQDEWSGIARVSVDGVLRAEIDTYASAVDARSLMYTLTGFSPGPHTLTIEPTGRFNPATNGLWVWIDAFEIVP